MKQFTFAIFLFSLITSSSQAQRGWRLFSGMGVTGPVHVSMRVETAPSGLVEGDYRAMTVVAGNRLLESLAGPM